MSNIALKLKQQELLIDPVHYQKHTFDVFNFDVECSKLQLVTIYIPPIKDCIQSSTAHIHSAALL